MSGTEQSQIVNEVPRLLIHESEWTSIVDRKTQGHQRDQSWPFGALRSTRCYQGSYIYQCVPVVGSSTVKYQRSTERAVRHGQTISERVHLSRYI